MKEEKIYGVHEAKADKVLCRFQSSRKNLGAILSGSKGIGKSLFARVLANKAIEIGMPVILVSEYIPGMENFIDSIKSEAMVLFDEFDKTFKRTNDEDNQVKLLSLFDGTSSGKKLFVITCNDYGALNEYLINRPGRFHFHISFDFPNANEVREYMTDKLFPEYFAEIDKVVDFSRRTKLNYDHLSAIVMELNEGEKFEEAIKDLNIIDSYSDRYNCQIIVRTHSGREYKSEKIRINLFDFDKAVDEWIKDADGSFVCRAVFNIRDMQISQDQDSQYIIPKEQCKFVYDEEDKDEKYVKMFKKEQFDYVELMVCRDAGLHYNLAY